MYFGSNIKFICQSGINVYRSIHASNVIFTNYYDCLEIFPSATQTEIKKSYYRLSKLYHPDTAGSKDENLQKFREICEAYDVLGNVKSRKLYDKGAFIKGKVDESFDTSRTTVKDTHTSSQSNVYQYGRKSPGDEWIKEATFKSFDNARQVRRKKQTADDEYASHSSSDIGVSFFAVFIASFVVPYIIYTCKEMIK